MGTIFHISYLAICLFVTVVLIGTIIEDWLDRYSGVDMDPDRENKISIGSILFLIVSFSLLWSVWYYYLPH